MKCVKCGNIFSATTYDSINVSMAPNLKDDLLTGKINQAICPKCNTKYNIGNALLYHDMNNGIMISVLLSEEYSNNKEEAIKEFTELMRKSVSSLAGTLRKSFEKYNFDVVFSIDELKESLNSMEGNCNEKIGAITKDVLRLESRYKAKEKSYTTRKIKKWFGKFMSISRKKNELEHNEELLLPEKCIVILGEKVSLKYFPELTKFAEIDPIRLKNTIHETMNKANVDAKNAMIILEKIAKRVAEKVNEKIEK
ncbi:MAG: CpXC domain-containing protein [Candidatus Moranbacteria bacterium]|nr:CpXC domain-containing protein [Candidatus Moranbacteria bacterium]